MSATTSTAAPAAVETARPARPVPPRGPGSLVNVRYLRVELRRLVRNRRTMVFSLVMPPVFFLIFGTNADYRAQMVGPHANVTAYVAVSMALYGAMLAAVSGGASVSVERAQGWTRQLRVTPLRPAAYLVTKVGSAMALGAVSVAVTLAVAAFAHAQMSAGAWAGCALLAWGGSVVFAAFGLFMGYLLPTENVMQVLGPITALLAFAGGLFVPIDDGSVFHAIAQLTPTYGMAELVRWPLGGDFSWVAVVNVVGWAAVFGAGAAWRFRRDTARV
ncbi:ABC transporter permease [Xylanimonas ulmi]|uniref:ABC-2 type transport system permease protein n=1 Tax=Xylanimonas ulmi TaxID=228973 RepID=A0A4Q7LYH8_9MICO|nr:ABC transporter permease [Xylanibacterium ulmi]RZS60296.1 ABC-2 type transport system permease protein [Xylanibacterium ulmi]